MRSSANDDALLTVTGLSAGYGKIRVLHDISISLRPGEVMALLGPNGAGKSTLLKAVSGLIPPVAGTVHFAGQDITTSACREVAMAGLSHVLQGHRVFGPLSVEDNLRLAAYGIAASDFRDGLEAAYQTFPELRERRRSKASSLSGGQQQMLAVAQGMCQKPKLLMLDEPSEGLAPRLVDRVLDVIRTLRDRGISVLLVEQLVDKALRLADRVCVLAHGELVLDKRSAEIEDRRVIENAYLGKTQAD